MKKKKNDAHGDGNHHHHMLDTRVCEKKHQSPKVQWMQYALLAVADYRQCVQLPNIHVSIKILKIERRGKERNIHMVNII